MSLRTKVQEVIDDYELTRENSRGIEVYKAPFLGRYTDVSFTLSGAGVSFHESHVLTVNVENYIDKTLKLIYKYANEYLDSKDKKKR